jgi:hypothetical protein
MGRGFDRLALERDPAEVLSTPSMMPAYVNFRPSTLLCVVIAGIAVTLGAGVAYDSLFWDHGSRNELLFTPPAGCPPGYVGAFDTAACGGVDVVGGEPFTLVFGSEAEPIVPLMRWLRVSAVIYVQLTPECAAHAAAEPEAVVPHSCVRHVPRNLLVSSTISARDSDAEPWQLLSESASDAQRIECIDTTTTHPGWPAKGLDPLALGRRAHCYLVSLAYVEGLRHAQYTATISIASEEPGKTPTRSWVQDIVLVQTQGTLDHGVAELTLRGVALVLSVLAFALFARAMHRHPLADWLPQQLGVYVFCLAICGYNNPAYLVFLPLGLSYNVAAAVFDIGFFTAGLLLATIFAEPIAENVGSLTADFWRPRLYVTLPLFFLNLSQYALSYGRMRADPSFMYELTGGFLACAIGEVLFFTLWSVYVVAMLAFQLRSHEARMRTNKKELAFAAVTALVVGTIWLRESVTFKVYTRDFMSDARFKYRARTVIICNVFAALIAFCYQPSQLSEAEAAQGGFEAVLARDLAESHARKAAAVRRFPTIRGGGSSSAASASAKVPANAADALRAFVDNLRRAHSDGVSVFSKAELENHFILKEALAKLPQTRAYVKQMAWVYPTLGFYSRHPYLWAIVLHDLDSPGAGAGPRGEVVGGAGSLREPRRSVHWELEDNNPAGISPSDTVGVAAAKEVLWRVKKVGLRASLHRAPLGGASDGSAFVILIGESAAIGAEYVRDYGERLMIEVTLDPELPPATEADKLAAIARLLTQQADLGDEHLPAGEITWRTDGLELVRGSFPLHDRGFNAQIDREWGLSPEISEAHLRVIRDHYGEELGWYFGLSDFTVEWLFPVASFGFVLEMVKLGGDIVFYEILWVAFGSALTVWGALFVAFWRRRSAELRWDWGVDSLISSERRNPYFTGEWHTDPETGLPKPVVHAWSRLPAFANTAFQMLLQVLLLCLIEYFSYGQARARARAARPVPRRRLLSTPNTPPTTAPPLLARSLCGRARPTTECRARSTRCSSRRWLSTHLSTSEPSFSGSMSSGATWPRGAHARRTGLTRASTRRNTSTTCSSSYGSTAIFGRGSSGTSTCPLWT